MDQKEMMSRLQQNPAQLQSLMQSQDGQRLMQLLCGSSSGDQLSLAAQQAAAGNPAQILKMLQQITSSPEGAALVQRISQQFKR